MKSFYHQEQLEIISINDYVIFKKPKNKAEKEYYLRKIFQVHAYDNKTRLYKIKQIYPPIEVPKIFKDDQNYMDVRDKYNQWDQSRLKKLKLAKYLYG